MVTLGYYVGIPFSNPFLRFYAICIVIGACVALVLSNYRAHKDGFDIHFFDSVFPIAFIAGIIGARIWYVIATYQQEFAGRSFWAIFDLRSGGLAIQGGAIGGILVGVLYCLFRRRGTSILRIADYAIPTILLAQAIGRWGNFFNQEVFGHFVSPDAWSLLPNWIVNNMQNGDLYMGAYMYNGTLVTAAQNGVIVPEGAIVSPLFLVEGVVNVMFFFLITIRLPTVLGKHFRKGDQSFAYFIAYGITRAILEPLRNPHFIMGTDGANKSSYKSLSMAIAFIVIGVVLILVNHVLHYLAEKGTFDRAPKWKAVFVEAEEQKVMEFEKKSSSEVEEEKTIDLSKLREKEKDLSEHKEE